ncbi:MAG: oligoendopeptidase F [Lachnospiraceae bacterium]|nr:oligoendopeptidase F [Lachnospiraceae bacterium]
MAKAVAKRSEIPVQKRWAVEDLYATKEAWEEALKKAAGRLEEATAYQGRLGESAQVLREYLDFEDDLEKEIEKVYMYAHLNMDVDTTNTEGQDMYMRAQMLSARALEATAFAKPEITAIAAETLAAYRASEPGLKVYDRFFTLLERRRAHTRSSEVEALLASADEMGDSPGNIYTMLNNADLKFAEIIGEDGEETQVTQGRYIGLMESKDRRVRKAAFESMYAGYGQFANTIAANFTANIRQASFFAKARGYASTRAMYLAPANVPEEVYDNLIAVIHEALPSMYRYVALRKKVLGVDELHMYDVYVPMVQECKAAVPFEEARATIQKALKPLGAEYLAGLNEGFENRWIDACENEGKRSGAYCSGGTVSHPFVLMTYKEKLDDMYTLAHEMGHAMHSYFSNKTQPHQTAGYKIFVAEVASTCNEILLTHYLLETTQDKAQRAYILNHFLDGMKGTMFRQTMFAEFEMQAHRMFENGEALTAERLNQVYLKLNQQYFGPDMVSDEEIRLEWAKIPHFYTPFYVYQYATGIAAAAALATRILELGEEGVRDYMKFLTGGGSQDPIDLLKLAGVDMSRKEPVQAAAKLFDERLAQLEELLA